MLGDLVYFGETLSIRVGEEKNGIKIIGVTAPSNVLIEHARGSYSVPIWTPVDWSKFSSEAAERTSHSVIQPVASPTINTDVANDVVQNPVTQGATEIAPPPPAVPVIESSEPSRPSDVATVVTPAPIEPVADESDTPDPDAPTAERANERPTAPLLPASAQLVALGNSPTINPPTTIPESLNQAQIDALTPAEAQVALARVSRARQSVGLTQATQHRLRDDAARLRVRVAGGGQ